LNTKDNARNTKQYRIGKNPNYKNKNVDLTPVVVLDFGNFNFGFVSGFDTCPRENGDSDFEFALLSKNFNHFR